MSRMGSSCSALRQRAFLEGENGRPVSSNLINRLVELNDCSLLFAPAIPLQYDHSGDASTYGFHRSVRHSVVSQVG